MLRWRPLCGLLIAWCTVWSHASGSALALKKTYGAFGAEAGGQRRLQQGTPETAFNPIPDTQPKWWTYRGPQPVSQPPAQTAFVSLATNAIYAVATDGTVQRAALSTGVADLTFTPVSFPGPVLELAAGFEHTLAVLAAGRRVVGIGRNNELQVTIPAAATANVSKVAVGRAHSLALLLNGTVLGWGSDYYQQATVPADVKSAVASQIAAGGVHSCAVLAATGGVRCWGDNSFGQATPPPEAASGVKSISAGTSGTVALKEDGTLVAWGDIGDMTLYASPNLPQITDAVSVSMGDTSAAAVLSDGSIFMWGLNPLLPTLDGILIPGISSATGVSVMSETLVVRVGPAPLMTVGPVAATEVAPAPPPPQPTPRVQATAPTSIGSTVVMWGDVGLQATGLTAPAGSVLPPLTSICSGYDYTLGLLPNGTVILLVKGNVSTVASIPAAATANVTRISCGNFHALALKSAGTVVGIGSDALGAEQVPAQLASGRVTAISAGSSLSLAVQNGAVVAWPDGTLTLPEASQSNIKDVAAGTHHGLALTNSGSVIGLPNVNGLAADIFAQSEVPPAAASGVKAIAAGLVSSLALKNDGSVVAWGDRAFGAAVVPAGLTNVTAVAATEGYSAALKGDGTVVVFGKLPFPTVPPAAAGSSAIAPGPSHMVTVVGPMAALGSPIPVLSPPPPPAQTVTRSVDAPASDSKSGISAGAIGGIVGGVVGGLLLLGLCLLFALKRRRSSSAYDAASDVEGQVAKAGAHAKMSAFTVDDVMVVAAPNDDAMNQDGEAHIKVAGLLPGDPFLKATSKQYRWAEAPVGPEAVGVEAGITDQVLDQALPAPGKPSPVRELSSKEVYDQLELLPDGLLGRGAAAYVFKARWPSRFGPDGLVAVKLLKDAYRCDQSILMSFNHEARLLESVRHPNVVRLYGYCLDPPCVCLILELLPHNLNERLYPGKVNTNTSQFAKMGSTNGLDATGMSALSPTALMSPGSDGQFSDLNTMTDTTTNGATVSLAVSSATNMGAPDSTTTTGVTNMSEASTPLAHAASLPTPHGTGPMIKAPPLSMMEALLFSWDIASGLSYLHDRNVDTKLGGTSVTAPIAEEGGEEGQEPAQPTLGKIVHRDLKPANILFNSKWVAKISDFGLGREHENTTIHTEHVGAGTLAYMAPELLRGRKGARSEKPTNRVDIYSLAIMMHEMISRKKPWANYNEMQMMLAVCNKQRPRLPMRPAIPPPLPENLAAVPASFELLPELSDLITACWHSRELKRPTATEVLDTLSLIMRKVGVPDPLALPRESLRLPDNVVVETPPDEPAVEAPVTTGGDDDGEGDDEDAVNEEDLQTYAKHG